MCSRGSSPNGIQGVGINMNSPGRIWISRFPIQTSWEAEMWTGHYGGQGRGGE